jgi:hypothetical protein
MIGKNTNKKHICLRKKRLFTPLKHKEIRGFIYLLKFVLPSYIQKEIFRQNTFSFFEKNPRIYTNLKNY